MSLRDWFAGQALAGELAAQDGGESFGVWNPDVLAEQCFKIADAMLAERAAPEAAKAAEAAKDQKDLKGAK